MQTPQLALPPYSQHRYRHMGLGWFLDVDSRHPKMNHDGATMQQFASLHLLPKRKQAFALLFNSPSPLLPSEVRETILPELAGVPAIPKPARTPPIVFYDQRRKGTQRSTGHPKLV